MIDATKYTITVRKVEEDGDEIFKASVRELPNLVAVGQTFEEAYGEATSGICGQKELADELGHSFPLPAAEPPYDVSGRLTVRLPVHLHRKANRAADEDECSVNSLIIAAVTQYLTARECEGRFVHRALGAWYLPVAGAGNIPAMSSDTIIWNPNYSLFPIEVSGSQLTKQRSLTTSSATVLPFRKTA